jgi:hypothetical protein
MICIIVIEVLIVFIILTINDNWYLFEFQTLFMSSCFSRTQINITKWFAPIMIEVLIVFIVILIINDELMVDIYSSCKPSVVITVSIHSRSNWSKCLWWPFHIEWHDLLLSARTTVISNNISNKKLSKTVFYFSWLILIFISISKTFFYYDVLIDL